MCEDFMSVQMNECARTNLHAPRYGLMYAQQTHRMIKKSSLSRRSLSATSKPPHSSARLVPIFHPKVHHLSQLTCQLRPHWDTQRALSAAPSCTLLENHMENQMEEARPPNRRLSGQRPCPSGGDVFVKSSGGHVCIWW